MAYAVVVKSGEGIQREGQGVCMCGYFVENGDISELVSVDCRVCVFDNWELVFDEGICGIGG